MRSAIVVVLAVLVAAVIGAALYFKPHL